MKGIRDNDVPRLRRVLRAFEANDPPERALPTAHRQPPVLDRFLGVIVEEGPESESDFEDARYWVQAADPETAGDNPLAATVRTGPRARHVTATNWAEVEADTHLLPAGTVVHVFGGFDAAGEKLYWFVHGILPEELIEEAGEALGIFVAKKYLVLVQANGDVTLEAEAPWWGRCIDLSMICDTDENVQTGFGAFRGNVLTLGTWGDGEGIATDWVVVPGGGRWRVSAIAAVAPDQSVWVRMQSDNFTADYWVFLTVRVGPRGDPVAGQPTHVIEPPPP